MAQNNFQVPDGSKDTLRPTLTEVGSGEPFITVSFDGLLWGYEDELPCLPLDVPKGCDKGDSPFDSVDPFDNSGGDDDWDFKRRKRSISGKDYRIVEKPGKIMSLILMTVSFKRLPYYVTLN